MLVCLGGGGRYDSMGAPGLECLQHLRRYLQDEKREKKQCELDMTTWTDENLVSLGRTVPQQQNGSDCGVFMCMFSTYHAQGRDWAGPGGFTQRHMPHFRRLICHCIMNKTPPPECFAVGGDDSEDEEDEDEDEAGDSDESSELEMWDG